MERIGFAFELGEKVEIAASCERGVVVGRGEYINADPQYLIRYKNGQRVAIESWWAQDALRSLPSGE